MVADNQFSTLGTVLLATLADLTRVLQLELDSVPPSQTKAAGSQHLHQLVVAEDVGEPVSRREDVQPPVGHPRAAVSRKPAVPDAAVSEGSKSETKRPPKAPKKKSRKKDAIDDLFNDFV